MGTTWCEYLRLRAPLVTRSKTYNRLTRNGIHNVIPLNSETIVVLVKRRFLVFQQKSLMVEVQINKGSRPLRQGVLKKNDQIIYGSIE